MNGLALIVGNSEYLATENRLNNAENDAHDFSDTLIRLGFIVKKSTNAEFQTLDTEIDRFGRELDQYDIGIFYFAGHGMQIDGENFITAINTNFENEVSAKYTSITLNKILSYMERAKNNMNILILDACRDNPFERSWNRSIQHRGLAPMYAPKGTLIAYATSPGEKASDGSGRNGLYTSALLKHIEDQDITIEELFKRVRNSVFAFSNGRQTSWEHTSLTGTFKFNSGQMVHAINTPYISEAIEDAKYVVDNRNNISSIIKELKTNNWYKQQPAIEKIKNINVKAADKNDLFVLGRNILQTADGGENSANEIIDNLQDYLNQYKSNNANHILAGILFEIYFNSNGQFRYERIKSTLLDKVFRIGKNKEFKEAFDFIKSQLKPFEQRIFFIPGSNQNSVSLDVIFEIRKSRTGLDKYYLIDIKHEGKSVLVDDERNTYFGSEGEYSYESLTFSRLKNKISGLASIPPDMLTLATREKLTDDTPIGFPFGSIILKSN